MPRSLYAHIPFCPQICPYCAFTSLAGSDHLHARYVEALGAEIGARAARRPQRPLQTVYFGGGTPTQMEAELLGCLLRRIDAALGIDAEAEITVEANPGTVDGEKFARLRQLGCNRLSLGVQSFDDGALKKLGRAHGAAEAERAYARARAAGFANINIDLILSVPGVEEAAWKRSVARAVELAPEHVSIYALSIEEGTVFARRHLQGRFAPLDEEEDAAQYEWAAARLQEAGYVRYEVSNFARPGYYSRHNWGYWTGAEYLGVGLSAHSYMDRRRCWNVRDLGEYLRRVEQGVSPEEGHEYIDDPTARRERFWLGLRTHSGVALSEDERDALEADERFAHLRAAGYCHVRAGRLCLAPGAFAVADALSGEITDILERAAGRGRTSIGMGSP